MGITESRARCECGAYMVATADGRPLFCLGGAHKRPVVHVARFAVSAPRPMAVAR